MKDHTRGVNAAIKRRMKRMGMTTSEFAAKSGIPRSSLEAMLNSRRRTGGRCGMR